MRVAFWRKPASAITHEPGIAWDGPAACFDGPDVDHRRGIYALDSSGRNLLRPLVRLVAVDDSPGDVKDGAFHYEVAGPTDGSNKTCDGSPWPYKGEGVLFEAHLVGKATAGGDVDQKRERLNGLLTGDEIDPTLRAAVIKALRKLDSEDAS